MKWSALVLVACVAGVNAFVPTSQRVASLQRSTNMLQQQRPATLNVAKSSLTALKQTESATIVAAEKTSFIDKIWNSQTKLTIYLGIWYLGNIYCESGVWFPFAARRLCVGSASF